jgi:hypothetical protein
MENSIANIESCTHPKAKKALEATIYLHAISHIQKNLHWYLIDGSVSMEAGAALEGEFNKAVKDFLPYMNTVLDSLGLPNVPDLYGPIARDYVAFNSQNDSENMEAAGKLFDYRTTGDARPKL